MLTITPEMVAGGRTLAEARLSPDGAAVAFLARSGAGTNQLLTVPTSGGPEVAVTAEAVAGVHPSGGGAHTWLGSTHLAFVGRDRRLHRVRATGGPSSVVVDVPGGCSSPAADASGATVAFVVDGRHVGIVAVPRDAPPGWPVRVSSGRNDFALDPTVSPDGRWVAWHEWDVPDMPWDGGRIVLAATEAGSAGERVVVAGGAGVAVQQPRFSPDGRRLGWLSDVTGWLNVWVAEVAGDGTVTGARVVVDEPFKHGGPAAGPGQRSWAWSPTGDAVAFCRNEGGFARLCAAVVPEPHAGVDTPPLEWSKGQHLSLSWAGDALACIRSGGRTPTHVVAFAGAADAVGRGGGRAPTRTALARGPVAGFDDANLAEPEVVHWSAADGAVVHGRLYRTPRPPDGGPPPLLVWIHGGPVDQQRVAFNPRLAYFAERGWSVLVPDHRGSTGWGRAFTAALGGAWGELDVSDVADGMAEAARQGWGDARRMVPIGGSAGGFTVLNLLARHGDRCAAGVALYPVTDLLELTETTHRFERHATDRLVGPLPDAAGSYRDRSPLQAAAAGAIRAPLLLLSGSDDPVVPSAQADALRAAVAAAGGTVEAHCYEGEGHGWSRAETVEDELRRIESFLRRRVLRWLS